MKKIIALALASVLFVTSSVCVFAQENTNEVLSPEARLKELEEQIDKLTETIDEQSKTINNQSKAIKDLANKIKAQGSGGGGGGHSRPSSSSGGNYVNFGGTMTYQGGKIEINGGRSNVTFTIKAPAGGTVTSAASLAARVGGSLVSCIETSSPGVAFNTAKVNFYVAGVQAGENIAVYQAQGKDWVQLPVVEIRKDHVVVNMSRHGSLAFIRVPAMATITQ